MYKTVKMDLRPWTVDNRKYLGECLNTFNDEKKLFQIITGSCFGQYRHGRTLLLTAMNNLSGIQ